MFFIISFTFGLIKLCGYLINYFLLETPFARVDTNWLIRCFLDRVTIGSKLSPDNTTELRLQCVTYYAYYAICSIPVFTRCGCRPNYTIAASIQSGQFTPAAAVVLVLPQCVTLGSVTMFKVYTIHEGIHDLRCGFEQY